MDKLQSLPTESIKRWFPAQFTLDAHSESGKPHPESKYSVLILNVPLQNRSHFLSICKHARLRACADGGANRVIELGLTKEEENDCHIDFVCGDFDSIDVNVLQYYKERGADVCEDHDQNSTDLMKTLKVLEDRHVRLSIQEKLDVAIFGGLEGRADQALSQLHQLYLTSSAIDLKAGDLYLITFTSVIFLLKRGLNRIHIPLGNGAFTENAGIVPLAGPATLTTRGFEWDLDNDQLQFGRCISTSNHILREVVEVQTNEPVIFTLEWG